MTYQEIQKNEVVNAYIKKGNAINRSRHAEYGALLADTILRETDMALEDRITVMATIGNHDESTGTAVDAEICTMYEYFEIFLGRMVMCRRAAEMLGAKFKLKVNGSKVL